MHFVDISAIVVARLTLSTVYVPNVNSGAFADGKLTKCTPTSPTQRS